MPERLYRKKVEKVTVSVQKMSFFETENEGRLAKDRII